MNSGGSGGLVLAPKAGSDPKAHEPDLAGRGINQHIRRLHIFVDQLPFVQAAECCCEADSEALKTASSPSAPK